ncbi:hypothetical protein Moror_5076 [Moniliophthora roreri MCA 2997]|uniref:Uncharacterized protein n=1 Tax=Moniliophthora roreri (strain MCA 2997) TaxID=1381753 RepID=V2WXM7_MONRO|nr:hypothetical protein Moror_5076 [Moniliophthora roreri MCA 2997]
MLCEAKETTKADSRRTKVGLGKKEFCAGLNLVALSRVKILDGLMIVDKVDYSRVKKLGGAALKERKE